MSLEQYYMLAQIVASVAVFGSLLFLAFEMRRNAKQTRLANWESIIGRFNALWSRTNDLEFSDVVRRGREGLANLSETEKISFGHYHHELLICYESMTVRGDHPSLTNDQLIKLAVHHLRYHFSFPGVREWWAEWSKNMGAPPGLTAVVNEAIRLGPPS